jgi:transposase
MEKGNDLLNEIADILTDFMNIARVVNYDKIKSLLSQELDTKEKRLVYELSDGVKTVREISQLSGVNISSISTWSQYWEQLGILVETRGGEVKGRRKKLFTLSSYGIKTEIQEEK